MMGVFAVIFGDPGMYKSRIKNSSNPLLKNGNSLFLKHFAKGEGFVNRTHASDALVGVHIVV